MTGVELVGIRSEEQFAEVRSFSDIWVDMVALKPVARHESMTIDPRTAHTLCIVEDALAARGAGGARSVPSAGALFPYDFLVVSETAEAGQPAVFWIDLSRRACIKLPLTMARAVALRAALDRDLGGEDTDHVVLLARPWLSMRKYGPRGYLYTHLDAGHAATNLLGTALGRGRAVLRLRPPRQEIRSLITEFLPYREVHSVVSIAPRPRVTPVGGLSYFTQSPGSPADSHGDLERFCWTRIPGDLPDGGAVPARIVTAAMIETGPRLAPASRIGRHEWRALARLRHSCKGFGRQSPSARAIAATLGALDTELPTDLDPVGGDAEAGVRAAVVIGSAAIAEACAATLPSGGISLKMSSVIGDPAAITRLCVGQKHIGDAQALVVFHIPRSRFLVAGRPQVLRDSLFRASAAAQLLYLGAARNEVAITAVGGFDAVGMRAVADVSDDDVLYVLALGVETGGNSDKIDRRPAAHAHGE